MYKNDNPLKIVLTRKWCKKMGDGSAGFEFSEVIFEDNYHVMPLREP